MNEQLYVGTRDGPISTSDYPDFDDITPTAASTQEGIDIDSAYLYYKGCCYGLAIRYSAYLTVSKAGIHSFSLESTGISSRMFIDGVLIAAYGGVDAVYLLAGQYEVRVEFFHGIDVWYLQWKWQQPGEEMVLVPKERLTPLTCLTIDAAGRCKAPPLSGLGIHQQRYRGTSDSPISSSDYPDFDDITPTAASTQSGIDIDSAYLYFNGCCYGLAIRYTAYLTVSKAGIHSFSLDSGNATSSRMFIDGALVIENGGVDAVYLLVGQYEVRVEFFDGIGVEYLQWKWQQPGEEMVLVPKERMTPLPCLTIDAAGRCKGGMRTALYRAKTGESTIDFPSFETRDPDEIWKNGRNVDFSDDDWSSATYVDRFASRHSGYLLVDVAGSYTFYLTSDDGSRMYLDGNEIINNGGTHGEKTVEATRVLEPGMHEVRIEYFEDIGGQMLRWEWLRPAQTDKVVVPLEVLFPLYCLRVDAADGRCVPEVTLA
ncbi:hypothetical protein DIPPA_31763 [Diplonema papillatum]|nr:hypothetical protein DIPPA_31763 [Diplonema papillatum]